MATNSKGNAFSKSLLDLIFRGTAITALAQNHATPTANLFVSLHTSSPGEGGAANTNEVTTAAYGQYARASVNRTGTGWDAATTADPAVTSPSANIDFTEMTSGTGTTISHFGITTAATGATPLLYYGTVTPNIAVTTGVTPRLTTGSTISET